MNYLLIDKETEKFVKAAERKKLGQNIKRLLKLN